ncbi:MAG: M48 family metalloprotease, partial [Gemmatimonadota bacterium]|nr:M48 family metalloprotease [Gemmatimonadota bacterium]
TTRVGTSEERGGSATDFPLSPLSSLIGVFCLCSLTACGPVTVVGGPGILAPRVSEGQEIRAGQRAAGESSRTLGLVADQALQDYVQQVGVRVAAVSERSHLPWTFRVLDDPMPNAFGLPGGYVFVTRGILGVINSEAELAGVLAHEIGHVNARHGVQALARQSGAQLGVWAVPVPELRALDGEARVGAGLLFVEHGADAERQADDLGFRYMLAAGYDIRELDDLLAALGRLEAMGGRSALPSWLTTHPDPGERVDVAARRASAVQKRLDSLRQNRSDYLDQLEDLVYGEDPRQGFFRSTTFFHPELRFRLDLPSGWRYRNLSQVVVATSADRGGAIQLTLVEQEDPAEAAERFIGQDGISTTGELSAETVNGNPALFVPFQASTRVGNAAGLAAWIGYGGRTYQIVGLAASQAANGHAEAFRETLHSFAPATDARLFDVRPYRINIVRLGRATTFADFNRRYPSAVDAEEVALLNRVTGGSSRLRAGGRMKRVVKG